MILSSRWYHHDIHRARLRTANVHGLANRIRRSCHGIAEHVDTNITAEVWSAVIGYSPRRIETINTYLP